MQRGQGSHAPPRPVKISHKKMAAEGGRIDFMFLGPPLYPAAGSATEKQATNKSSAMKMPTIRLIIVSKTKDHYLQ